MQIRSWRAIAGGPAAGEVRHTAAADRQASRASRAGDTAGRLPLYPSAPASVCRAGAWTAAGGDAAVARGPARPGPRPPTGPGQPRRRSTDSSLLRVPSLSQPGPGPGWTAEPSALAARLHELVFRVARSCQTSRISAGLTRIWARRVRCMRIRRWVWLSAPTRRRRRRFGLLSRAVGSIGGGPKAHVYKFL